MKILTFLLLLALLFVAGGFFLGRPMFGGGAIGIILHYDHYYTIIITKLNAIDE